MSTSIIRVALLLAMSLPTVSHGENPARDAAEAAFTAGDYTQASRLYQQALAAAPDNLQVIEKLITLDEITEGGLSVDLRRRALSAAIAQADYAAIARYSAELEALLRVLPPELEARYAQAAALDGIENGDEIAARWTALLDSSLLKSDRGEMAAALDYAGEALRLASSSFGHSHPLTAISLREKALTHVAAGEAANAVQLLDSATLALTDSLGPDHPETAALRSLSGDLALQLGSQGEAMQHYVAAEHILRRTLPGNHPLLLELRERIVELLRQQGELQHAVQEQGSICADNDSLYGTLHPLSANCYRQLANLETEQGDLQSAGGHYREALERMGRLYAPSDSNLLLARTEQAELWRREGRMSEAEKALRDVLSNPGADAEVRFAGNNYLAQVVESQGKYAQARKLLGELLAFSRSELGDEHPSTLTLLNNLAGVERRSDLPMDAERHYLEVLHAYTTLYGEAHPVTLAVRNNLALLYENQGLYDLAEPLFEEGLVLSQAQGKEHPTTLAYLNNLALLHESQGRFALAERDYTEALRLYSAHYGEEHPETQVVRNNLAYLYLLDNRYEDSARLMQQVLDGWTAAFGEQNPKRLKALNTLARVRHRQGKLMEAEVLFEQALAERRSLFTERHRDTIRSLLDLANLYLDQGRREEGIGQLRHTLELSEEVLGKQHPYTFEIVNSLAQNLPEAEAYPLEQELFSRRTKFLDRTLWVTSADAREGYLRLYRRELDRFLELLNQRDPASSARDLLAVSLQRKGLLLKVASETLQVARLSEDPQLLSFVNQLTTVRKELAAKTLAGPADGDVTAHHASLAALESQVSKLEAKLGQASSRFRRTIASYGPEAIEGALPVGSVLVDFQLYHDSEGKELLAASLLAKSDTGVHYSSFNYSDISQLFALIVEFRTLIQDVDASDEEVMEIGQEIYSHIWSPLADELAGYERVYLAPDGMLHILPFAALADDGGRYLIEQYDLHVLTTPRDLLGKDQRLSGRDYMILAGPDYDTEAVTGQEQLQEFRRSRSARLQRGMRLASRGLRGLRFSSLPGAEKEGRIIEQQAVAQKTQSTIYLKSQAQERVLRELKEVPAVLHMATHGFFLAPDDGLKRRLLKAQRGLEVEPPPPGDNPLLRSGLAFAGVNSNAPFLGEMDTDNDGVLTALEVLGLNLEGNKLAVLSACETGLGEIHEGEGVFGLRRSFLLAGSEAVVTSLWEVSDAGTQTLMSEFYKRLLNGEDAHEALRNTQLNLRKSDRWGYPYVWASFMIVGI